MFMELKPPHNLFVDKIFKIIITTSAFYILILIVYLIIKLFLESGPIWQEIGFSFIINSDWNTIEGRGIIWCFARIFLVQLLRQ